MPSCTTACTPSAPAALRKGSIDTDAMRNLEYLYRSYHALGGNGTGTELYNRAKALPIRND